MSIYYEIPPEREEPTRRQLEVLGQLAMGRSYAVAASALGISHHTIKNHLYELYQRLGASDATHALALCVTRGYIKLRNSDHPEVEQK